MWCGAVSATEVSQSHTDNIIVGPMEGNNQNHPRNSYVSTCESPSHWKDNGAYCGGQIP